MKKNKVFYLAITAIGAAINMVGANIGLAFRLPLYLDAIGTIFTAVFLGPVYGLVTGLISSLLNQFTDPFALWFYPSNALAAILAGILIPSFYKKEGFSLKLLGFTLLISLPGTIISSYTAAYLFDGVTSAGSSIIVQLLDKLGVDLVFSVFITQIVTEYLDRLLALILTLTLIRTLPKEMKEKRNHGSL